MWHVISAGMSRAVTVTVTLTRSRTVIAGRARGGSRAAGRDNRHGHHGDRIDRVA